MSSLYNMIANMGVSFWEFSCGSFPGQTRRSLIVGGVPFHGMRPWEIRQSEAPEWFHVFTLGRKTRRFAQSPLRWNLCLPIPLGIANSRKEEEKKEEEEKTQSGSNPYFAVLTHPTLHGLSPLPTPGTRERQLRGQV